MMTHMVRRPHHRISASLFCAAAFCLCAGSPVIFFPARLSAQKIVWNAQEQPIVKQLGGLRNLSDDVRARATAQLALEIRQLPVTPNKVTLANDLASLSTEGDFGRDTLQEVTTTLSNALHEHPLPTQNGKPALAYMELAQLVRYEHMKAAPADPQFAAAIAAIKTADKRRERADFTLTDLSGKSWTLQHLHGKVVLVNFWATWCPPCRKEMPDLESLYHRFQQEGFVILAISDEDLAKVKPFIAERNITYPVLLDPGRKANDLFEVQGIPKSFVYDREGKLVSESIDMRTQKQFLEMLTHAGLSSEPRTDIF
jgi:peroxiredoxin